jgi:predicted permease
VRRVFRARTYRPDAEADVREEIQAHLELKVEELVASGLPEDEARAEAERCFGDVGRVRSETTALARSRNRRRRLADWIDTLRQDLRYGLRVLRRAPGFTTVTVLILALGIGVNTALFSTLKAVLLDPLPLPEAEELVFVWERNAEVPMFPASFANYSDWRQENRTFEEMGAYITRPVNVTDLEDPVQLRGALVTASLFRVLGMETALGRIFTPEEDEEGRAVAVLSHELWRARYAGDASLVGNAIHLNGEPYTVVGVMPPELQLPDAWVGEPVSVWTPLPFGSAFEPRASHSYQVLARLREGVSLEGARADMDRLALQLAEAYPDANTGAGIRVERVHEILFGEVGGQILLVLGAAGLVLLIACGNVASMYLARATGRQTEMAVRSALGASGRRVSRQLLTESGLLAAAGGIVGVLMSIWSLDALRSLTPSSIPRAQNIHVDGWVLLFALGAAVATGLLFGLAPALSASRTRLAAALREGRRGSGRGGGRSQAQAAFMMVQFALSLVLANAALLLMQSYVNLRATDTGVASDNILTMAISLRGRQYSDFRERTAFYGQLLPRLESLPGVTSVGAATSLPLQGGSNTRALTEEEWPDLPMDEGHLVDFDMVAGEYFESLGIPLLAGRHLREGEDDSRDDVRILVNRAAAQALWPGEDPLGKRITFSDDVPDWMTVVGVVGDTRQRSLAVEPSPQVYFLYSLLPTGQMFLTLRAEAEAALLARSAQQEITRIDPLQAVSRVRTMQDIVGEQLSQREFYTTLIGAFSLLALLLAAAGVYGVISYHVARRTHEIGVRLALGAEPRTVFGIEVGQAVRVAGFGLALGGVGVLATTRVIRRLLHGVEALDLPTLTGGVALLLLVALVAASAPALRATRVSPVEALRAE